MDILGVDAAVRAVLRVAVDGGGVEQRFGRDAAAVQAGAARLAPLDAADILGGAEVDGGILWCVTELVSKTQLDKAVSIVKEVLK